MSHAATPSTPSTQARAPRQAAPQEPTPTGWVGWIVFAATLMVITGVFQAIEGLVALFKTGYYLVPSSNLTVQVDYTAWGWTHLIWGVIVAAAGVGLFTGQMWARVVGVVAASLSMLLNFAFLAAYPVWSTLIIALDVFVILAITVHGREMKTVSKG
jgi:hypothetical protein